MQEFTKEMVQQIVTEAIKDPVDFATSAQELPPQLVHHLHTLLITTLLLTIKKQEESFTQIAAALQAVNQKLAAAPAQD